MEVSTIQLEPSEARKHYEEYLKHRKFETPVDAEIKRAYRAIAMGGTVIQALKSIVNAGTDERGRPHLAITRADQTRIICSRMRRDGQNYSVTFEPTWRTRASDVAFEVRMPITARPPNTWGFDRLEAIVPIIPLHLRPRTQLAAYHILWEADWQEVPRDPFLLKSLGKGDLWLVVAAWDLTEIERTVLQARVQTN